MFLVNTRKCLNIFDDVYVSSDSHHILKQARKVGAKTIWRDEKLCGDTPNITVYQHALAQIEDVDGIVAVQANSPTVESNLIVIVKKMMEMGIREVKTCHEDYSDYGSIWGLTSDRIRTYKDPYHSTPEVLIKDTSIDIHDKIDFEKALWQSTQAL